jgi:cytochrome c biogenesis protein
MAEVRAPGAVRSPGGTPGESATPPPFPGGAGPRPFGLPGWARWAWRQLTSMRTALILLFLLAAGSVPGSVIPQQGIDAAAVQSYYKAHPALAPILARLGLFDVFGSPWFAAIYILLFISLAGCVVPRAWRLLGSARALPPRAPRNLSRLPHAVRYATTMPVDGVTAAAAAVLAGRRFRLQRGDGWVSAEKGYLRDAGNLLFHVALLGVLFSVALGGLFGYKADRLLVSGQTFADTVTALDEFHPGRLVSAADLPPFTLTLERFTASYVMSGPQREQPLSFDARVRYTAQPGGPARTGDLQVNHPLGIDGAKVYLLGHGYAPVFRVTDSRGQVVYDQATPFVPQDMSSYLSEGVVKVPDAQPQQLGFAGIFLPTAVDVGGQLQSAFPAAYAPAVSLIAYSGNLGMNSGAPQSVYELDTAAMHRLPVKPQVLTPGQSMKLPGGQGTITFTGYRQWVSLAINHDPGQIPALISAAAALLGLLLSFVVRRRRVFIRAWRGADGATVAEVAGLPRHDVGGGFDAEFSELAATLRSAHQGGPPPGGEDGPPPGGQPAEGGGENLTAGHADPGP